MAELLALRIPYYGKLVALRHLAKITIGEGDDHARVEIFDPTIKGRIREIVEANGWKVMVSPRDVLLLQQTCGV